METSGTHNDFNMRVVRYLSGEMDADEQMAFVEEMRRDPEKRAIFKEYSKIWTGVDQLAAESKYDLDREWKDISEKVGLGRSRITRSRSVGLIFYRVAAVVAIGLISLTILYTSRQLSRYDRIAVESGTEVIDLPDGSRVTLNQGSSLKYFSDVSASDRSVRLKGEGFFEVARDTARPFTIDAGAAIVKVLGTRFNVSAYQEDEQVEVQVNSGMVSMSSKKDADNLIILNPGNTGVYDRGQRELKLIPEADPNTIAWMTREMVFTGTPLVKALDVIGHTYHVDMEIVTPKIAACPITVTFSGQELGSVINVLESLLDLEFNREGDRYFVSGETCE